MATPTDSSASVRPLIRRYTRVRQGDPAHDPSPTLNRTGTIHNSTPAVEYRGDPEDETGHHTEDMRPMKKHRTEEPCSKSGLTIFCERAPAGPATQPYSRDTPISKLPNEVLSQILLLASTFSRYPGCYKNLQLVSKAFRTLCINTPRMWNVVDSRKSIKCIRLHLERSKAAPLRLHLLTSPTQTNADHFYALYELINKNSTRIEVANVHMRIDKRMAAALDRDGRRHLLGWDMPALVRLTFDVIIAGDKVKVEDLEWKTPKLKSLRCAGSWERIAFPLEVPLKELHIQPLTRGLWRRAGELRRLISSSAKSLNTLVLDFSRLADWFTASGTSDPWAIDPVQPWEGTQASTPLEFPNLQLLRIILCNSGCNGNLFRLLKAFDFSNVPKIEISKLVENRLSNADNSAFNCLMSGDPTQPERRATVVKQGLVTGRRYDVIISTFGPDTS